MNEDSSRAQGQEYQQRMNGTGAGDIPTGYRPCPFCHSVIPWGSERCPTCGRVLIERVGPVRSQAVPSLSRLAVRWSSGIRPVLARVRQAVRRIGRPTRTGTSSATGGSWATTSRGTSWSMFQPAQRPVRSRWLGSIPPPTERERQILFIASAVMIIVFLIALIIR
ncbi:MAG: hypothetical protein WAW16_07495 [Candidatus Cryosericum sp.]